MAQTPPPLPPPSVSDTSEVIFECVVKLISTTYNPVLDALKALSKLPQTLGVRLTPPTMSQRKVLLITTGFNINTVYEGPQF